MRDLLFLGIDSGAEEQFEPQNCGRKRVKSVGNHAERGFRRRMIEVWSQKDQTCGKLELMTVITVSAGGQERLG